MSADILKAPFCVDVSSALTSEFSRVSKQELIAANKLAIKQIAQFLIEQHNADPKQVTIKAPLPSTVARFIGTTSIPWQVFNVAPSVNCKTPVSVCYPPPKGDKTKCKVSFETIYESGEPEPAMLLLWFTMNESLLDPNVIKGIDKLLQGETKDASKKVWMSTSIVVKPNDGDYMTDDNANDLLNATFSAADTVAKQCRSAKFSRSGVSIGIISSLPTALTIAVGMRFKTGLIGDTEVFDFKYNAGGYVAVGSRECDSNEQK